MHQTCLGLKCTIIERGNPRKKSIKKNRKIFFSLNLNNSPFITQIYPLILNQVIMSDFCDISMTELN
ncbi:hypothetical protein BpHYR1_006854 [Brachionus plicatilis]|uniref:Uncharacterized protein n=1 Tax=Brachionus plicatilis TaxID=10195 RepID=A0A3M7PA53_BRAPC|nr:hypothetical protein BpHYR1_006854 [Brachionus plicatilis]